MMREIVHEEKVQPKSNILEFYIKTNDIEEKKVRVLIDSGSDLNFIHPDFIRKSGIKTRRIEKPFNVIGLGQGIPSVKEETEKCILRFKKLLRNHSILRFTHSRC